MTSKNPYRLLCLLLAWTSILPSISGIAPLYADERSIASSDTSAISTPDSVRRIIPLDFLGSISRRDGFVSAIEQEEIPWIEYRSLSDLLGRYSGISIRDLGSPGQFNQMATGLIDQRGIGFSVDGHDQRDPITETYDLVLFPADAIQSLELIQGPRSFLYGYNSAGAFVNIKTKSYNTNRPYSRLRYSQGVNDYVQTDAIFSQNILTRTNLLFGLSRHTIGTNFLSDDYRGRFPNANYDAWSFRTKVRYDHSNSLNIAFSHLYHQTWTGLNDGVKYDPASPSDMFDEMLATVNNYDSYEKRFNNHLDLIMGYLPASDSIHSVTISGFYSNQLREYRDEANRYRHDNGIVLFSDLRSSSRGITTRYDWATSFHSLGILADLQHTQVEAGPEIGYRKETRLGASVKEQISIGSSAVLCGYGRIDRLRSQVYPGIGGDITLNILDHLNFYIGASQSNRYPTLQELNWPEDSLQHPTPRTLEAEKHRVAESRLHLTFPDLVDITLSASHRQIRHAIVIDSNLTPNVDNPKTLIQVSQNRNLYWTQISLKTVGHIGPIWADGLVSYIVQEKQMRKGIELTPLPALTLDGSLYYRDILFDSNLELKAGVRGRYYSKQTGMALLSQSEFFVPNPLFAYGPTGVADLFILGHIGDAYLHLIWENISNNTYMLTPLYPMYASNVRFGIAWEFND